MSSGNHMVDGADKALSRGDCACGGSWEAIEWCEQHAEECFFGPNCDMGASDYRYHFRKVLLYLTKHIQGIY